MRKAVRLLVVVMLTGLMLVTVAGPALALTSTSPTACWNNCGVGGEYLL